MIRGIRSVDVFPPLHQKSPSLFSNPKSLHDKVPTGWDKLTSSLISIETDKTVTKTGKASVYIMEIVDGRKPYQNPFGSLRMTHQKNFNNACINF
ncbi:hypothetical protein L1987_48904 [Smallanthus sonchifolius]|uniref:Uncharacterized protein n=1 Tax=Smallanthus sonchifolius TaxID=185202 RepID=A0ACB9FT98_9ASTR|nr:hypothetical protein L1987_48904 [Smallanthus sonchifolius]